MYIILININCINVCDLNIKSAYRILFNNQYKKLFIQRENEIYYVIMYITVITLIYELKLIFWPLIHVFIKNNSKKLLYLINN
jgi:hypothetical protein